MTDVLEVAEVHDADALAQLVPEWWALWQHAPAATPFQSPAWLVAWWEAFAPGRLFTIAVRDSRGLAALAPLYLETGAFGRRLLPVGISLSDYTDILVRADAAVDGIADRLSRYRLWDTLELGGLLPEAAALTLPCPADCTDTTAEDEVCPVLQLFPGPADAGSHPAIPTLQRRKLRMARNRLERGPVSKIIATHGLSPDQWADTLIALHTDRWQERGTPGVLANPRVQSFHRAALPSLIAHGIARLLALRIGSDIAGVYYGFSHRGRAYAYLGGFDPRFAYYSPGTVLLGHAIEDALREGARELHFLRGREPYKFAWGAREQTTFRRTLVRRTAHA